MVSALWHGHQSLICAFLGAVSGSLTSTFFVKRRKRRNN
jgi:hypothetical protein